MSAFEINGRMVGEGCVPYIVAEGCDNHMGDLDVAKEQIDKAVDKLPEDPFLLFIAGKIRFLLKDYDCAKPFLIKSYEGDKNSECENLLISLVLLQ